MGVSFHNVMVILGFPLVPLAWTGTFELILFLIRNFGSAAKLATEILGQGVTWIGFPVIVYLQWFILAPRIVRWGMSRIRGASDAT